MSRHMQLTTRIRPYYKKGLEQVHPRIAKRLHLLDADWAEQNPSLFEISGRLDQLIYRADADPPFQGILRGQKEKLQGLYEGIQEAIADWHLAEADKRLYEMEDVFEEIERELGKQ